MQLNPIPTLKQVNEYYREQFNYSAGISNIAQIRMRSKIILSKILKKKSRIKSLFDVGSGLGILVELANQMGIDATGIEPSKRLHELSRQFTSKTQNTYLEQYREISKKYDVITSIHVLEHVPDPVQHIKLMMNLLRPGGILFIETPNLSSHLYQFQKEKYTYLTPPDHIYIFSPGSLVNMLQPYSQKLIFTTYTYSEHLMGIVKALIRPHQPPTNLLYSQSSRRIMPISRYKMVKYSIFDMGLAKLCTPLLNIRNKGTFLEVLVEKQV